MSTIVTRSGKGTPLTNTEVDANFTNLNTDKAELSGANFTGSIDVTGSVTADGLTVSNTGVPQILIQDLDGTDKKTTLKHSNGTSVILSQNNFSHGTTLLQSSNGTTTLTRQKIDSNGDISFYNTAGTSQNLFWDSSTSRLGLGTTVPDVKLHISGTSGDAIMRLERNDNTITTNDVYGEIQFEGQDASAGSSAGIRGKIVGVAEDTTGAMGLSFETAGGYGSSTERLRIKGDGSSVFSGAVTSTGLTVSDSGNGIIRINGATGNTEALIFQRGGTEASRIGHSNSADLTFSTGSGVTEAMRISSAQNVNIPNGKLGVGFTTVPSSALHAKGGSIATPVDSSAFLANATARLVVNHGNEYGAYVGYLNSTNDAIGIQSARSTGLIGPLSLNPYGGNVGIGTNLPSSTLHIKTSVDNSVSQGLVIERSANTDKGYINYQGGAFRMVATDGDPIRFGHVSSSNEISIHTDGSLLVGKTVLGVGVDGAQFIVGGYSGVSATNNPSFFVNRNSGDGSVLEVGKNGVSVGSIGTSLTRLTIGSDDAMILFDAGSTNAIWPWTSTATSDGDADNSIDIGDTSNRFKDLYLSGKISTNTGTGLSITADSSNRGILNLSTSQAYQLIGGTHYGYTGYKTGGYHRWFGSDGYEDMRLSGGNLLVGTTDLAPAVSNSEVGVALSGSLGYVAASRSAGASGFFNRLSDGDIVNFNRSGATVGSIGTGGGDLNIGTGDTRIRFNDATDNLIPLNAGNGYRDNAISLGDSGARFKNLYLSGKASVDTLQFTQNSSATGVTEAVYRPTTGSIAFKANSNERMRIDSSGNLLVGTTEVDIGYTDSGAGVVLGADGWIQSARSSTAVNPNVYLNKLDSSGEIVRFAQDGNTVGSIGNIGGDVYVGNGNAVLSFNSSFKIISPSTTSATSDGNITLGQAGARFKDLYLSGGVYLGGTGAANKLSDFETGTFTPVMENVTGWSGSSGVNGTYTKIGNTVHVFISMASNVALTGTPTYKITGLPFSSQLVERCSNVSISRMFNIGLTTTDYIAGAAGTEIHFSYVNGDNNVNNLTHSGSTLRFTLSATYTTAS